jgi:hypothetical protein
MSYTKITDEGLSHLPLLHTLIAHCTEITDAGLKHLPMLHTLKVCEAKITDDGNINHQGGLYRSYKKRHT